MSTDPVHRVAERLLAAPPATAGLSGGLAGSALLLAELGRHDAGYRAHAHSHLAAAVAAPTAAARGLFDGIAGLGLVASIAARLPGEYGSLLASVDGLVRAQVRQRLSGSYDLADGLVGLGRYLLHRGEEHPELTDLLTRLVTSAHRGWWEESTPEMVEADPAFLGTHANLGMAHGVPGALALLALAWRAEVRVAGHDAAVKTIVDWLFEQLDDQGDGPYWPGCVTPRGPIPGEGFGWCYGTCGVARAIQLAAGAFDRPDWADRAVAVARTAVGRLVAEPGLLRDAGLCHGWAGVTQLTGRMAKDSGDPVLRASADLFAARLTDFVDVENTGFLDGAAGIGLALDDHARGYPESGNWDTALLIS
ncbi:lanthionine synthetase C family protein [Streptomyces sp. ID05-26A]|nr:lanthionine synthetase C family protein [Streptomyces sp. ID05-26A]